MNIFDVAARFRTQILKRERQAAGAMVQAYGQVWQSIQPQIRDLTKAYYAALEAGEVINPEAWLLRMNRLDSLQRQVEAQLRYFSDAADASIKVQQLQAIEAAQRYAAESTAAALGNHPETAQVMSTWNRVPTEAVEHLVGTLQDGSPLRSLLDELGPSASRKVGDGLIEGLAQGWNPRKIASRMRESLGGDLTRALRISRTEVLRSYRGAAIANYQANEDVVKGWIWHAAIPTCCPACWAMHGTKHSLDEQMSDHVNGRCAALPWTASWEELGFEGIPDSRPVIETGVDAFDKLTPAAQDAILGADGGAAYRAGAVELKDFVHVHKSEDWGTTRTAKSLTGILGKEEAGKYRELATVAPKVKVIEPPAKTAEDARLEILDIPAKMAKKDRDITEQIRQTGLEIRRVSAIDYTAVGPGGTWDIEAEMAAARKVDELWAKSHALQAERSALVSTMAEQARTIISVEKPINIEVISRLGATRTAQVKAIPGWTDNVKKIIGRNDIDGMKVAVDGTRRARSFATPGTRLMSLSPGAKEDVFYHELGHKIEQASPDVHAKAIDFLTQRTQGEKATWLGDKYAHDEITKRDKFLHPYMGKIYAGGNDTELISMGLQMMMTETARFAQEDPEYFRFIYDLLRGL